MNGYGRYSQAYKKAAVSTLDQRKLIVMLYDGAIKFLTLATDKMNRGDTYEAHRNLLRGKSIIAELLASLNVDAGGEIARNLQRLYTYMFNELIEANLNNDVERVGMVIGLLKELKVGWQGMKGDPDEGAVSQPEPAPARATKNINIRF
ncbi:MAG TPA: flagellar export chaperone FliS [bacterium]|nr:flagellar export chaperone FliS [bacterium]